VLGGLMIVVVLPHTQAELNAEIDDSRVERPVRIKA
jgi:hypothetical protein